MLIRTKRSEWKVSIDQVKFDQFVEFVGVAIFDESFLNFVLRLKT